MTAVCLAGASLQHDLIYRWSSLHPTMDCQLAGTLQRVPALWGHQWNSIEGSLEVCRCILALVPRLVGIDIECIVHWVLARCVLLTNDCFKLNCVN